ncbi:MAG: hypothetical protein HPY72_11565 [Anaerolineae bacterium]|nr:hypothetical protein [Anaerolineae bacterium]
MRLSKEQLIELGLRLKQHGVNKTCPLCNGNDLSIDDEIQAFTMEDGLIKEFFVMICPNCYATFFFPTIAYGLHAEGGSYPNQNNFLK